MPSLPGIFGGILRACQTYVCERFSMVEKQREGGAEREGTFLGVKFHNLAFLCGFLVSLSFNLSNGIHCSFHAIVKLR